MEPSTAPGIQSPKNTTCTNCDAPLPAGRLIRCDACIEAAQTACREITDRPILPSDIAAIRARGA